MASYNSKNTGNWDSESLTTWNEAGHPVAGDTVTFYDKDNNDVSDDTTSGTPVAGDKNMIVGNSSAGTNTWDGYLPRVIVYKGLLSRKQLSQFYTTTKNNYNL